jgi:hypothetical protein
MRRFSDPPGRPAKLEREDAGSLHLHGCCRNPARRRALPDQLTAGLPIMSTRTILIIVLLLLLLGALPTWPYSAGWGYYPSGGLGLILLIVIVLLLLGVI